MSEHPPLPSVEIYGQHLRIQFDGNTLFSLYRPLADRYLLTLEQDNGQYTLWMHPSNRSGIRLFSTCDAELAGSIMNITNDALQRMVIDEIQKPPRYSRNSVWLTAACAISGLLAGAWISWLITISNISTQFIPVMTRGTPVESLPLKQLPDEALPISPATPVHTTTANITSPIPPILSPEEVSEARKLLATRLQNGAARKEFTVTLSSGHPRTLFAFVDPECVNCLIFEPTLQALSEQYNVQIFPVTLTGKARTAERVAPVLCSPAEKRAAMWRDLFDTGAGMLDPAEETSISPATCEAGQNALARNDMAFDLYKLPGTPTVISDDGRLIPLQAMTSNAMLQAFLNNTE